MKIKHFHILFFVLFLFKFSFSYSQQEPLYTQYYNNYSLINPAYSGSHRYFTATSYLSGPWMSNSGGPESFSVSIHGATEQNFGVGLSVVHNNEYILDETRIFADFSYFLDVSDYATLAFGIKTGASLVKVDFDKIEQTEESLFEENIDEYKINVGAGLLYFSDTFFASLSVIDLVKIPYYDTETKRISKIKKMKMYLSAGYLMHLNKKWKLKPSFLIRTENEKDLSYDLSLNFLWNDQFGFGFSKRLKKSFSAVFQVRLTDDLKVSYSINTISKDSDYYYGASQDIKISFDLNRFGPHSNQVKVPFYW